MADLCNQCSIWALGYESKDLSGRTTDKDMRAGVAREAECEICGKVQVDPEGRCLSHTHVNGSFTPL